MATLPAFDSIRRRFNWALWDRFVHRPSANSYARQVSLDELSETARKSVEEQLAEGEQPIQMIFAPYQALVGSGPAVWVKGIRYLPWEYTRDRVIILTASRLLALDLDEDGTLVDSSTAPIESILSLQSGKILLFSWLEWVWATGNEARRVRCYFNTVCEVYYLRLGECVRSALAPVGSLGSRPADPSHLAGMPYKFRNMVPHYLLPGEKIERAVFRPAAWEKRVGLWKVHKLARAALVLTGAHLLVAEEDRSQDDEPYGLIVTFVPRERIRGLKVWRDGERVNLAVQVGQGCPQVEFTIPFQTQLRQEVEALVEQAGGAV